MISSVYKEASVLGQMKEAFEQQGVLLLPEFLSEKFYLELLHSLRKQNGKKVYEPARFSFFELSANKLDFFNSKEFKSFIKIVTGRLIDSGIKVSRFAHKDFTLLHDDFVQKGEIDLCFFILENEWDSSWGGNLVYSGQETKIVTPQPNSLAIIKSKDSQDFVKYLNHFAMDENFVLVKLKI